MMNLQDLGYTPKLEKYRKEHQLDMFAVGRVISEHKERYRVRTEEAEFEGEIIGNLRFTARERSDFPAVGDWVAISEYDEQKVLIHAVYPRTSTIERPAIGKFGERQIIASNVDYALLVQAVDRDFNLNRLERYMSLCHASRVKPVVVLTKIDLIDTEHRIQLQDQLAKRFKDVPHIAISNITEEGFERVWNLLQKGLTFCMLGSSGVGKSSLLNRLSGKELMKTGNISTASNKGQHITSHRELIVLDNGAILIDNPGMREVGITDSDLGLDATFAEIAKLSDDCRFKDCNHTHEEDCAVLQALAEGDIEQGAYDNYMKMAREKAYFSQTVAEKKRRDKEFGKMMKDFKRNKKNISNKHDT